MAYGAVTRSLVKRVAYLEASLEDIAAMFDKHAKETWETVPQMSTPKAKSNMRARAQTWEDAARMLRTKARDLRQPERK